MGPARHKHGHNIIKTLRFTRMSLLSSGGHVCINKGTTFSQSASTLQYVYANQVLTGLNADMSIGIERTPMLMLMSQPSSVAHNAHNA